MRPEVCEVAKETCALGTSWIGWRTDWIAAFQVQGTADVDL